MNAPIENIISTIEDNSPARIKLTLAGGHEHHFDCVFKEDTNNASHFYLVFPAGSLPDTIDQEIEHPVSIAEEDKDVSLNVSIINSTDERTLHVIAKSTLDPSSLRKYFRVNTTTEISASYKTNSQAESPSSWSINGQTMDLSASGVLAIFNDEPRNNEYIILEIYLPHQSITVNAISHVVHKKRLRHRRWLVAFHFDTISTKHRDSIITFLLAEQRKQLRENIRTRDL